MDREQKRRRRKRDHFSDTGRTKKKDRCSKVPKKESQSVSDCSSSRAPQAPKSAISLTPNAVESLATGASTLSDDNDVRKAKSNDLVVRLRVDRAAKSDTEDQALVATMSDGKHCMKVLVLNPSGAFTGYVVETGKDWIVSVHGYVTTEGQSTKYQLVHLVCLTSIAVLSTPSSDHYHLGTPFPTPSPQPSTRVHAGAIGSFMAQRAPFLTNEELAGSADISESLEGAAPSSSSSDEATKATSISLADHEDNVQKVRNFLAHHSAMITLQTSTSPSVDSTPTKRPTEHAVQNYTNGLREFSTSQLDRQKASLGTNAGREAADRASLIKERHNAALEMALEEKAPLSTSLLCSWHAALLQDLHSDAGKIRGKTVRAGHTVFAPPDRIRPELDMLFEGMESLEKRLNMSNAVHVILFAAVAMYGVVDIHPFSDGNGRLSRIVASWALRRTGLPFPINLFATPAQRADYVLALEKTRHFLSLTNARGTASRDEVLQAIKHTGVFAPLIRLLMDRVASAVLECNRVLEEKSGLAAEAAEARAARRARERSAQGTCIICLDEKPNIATLCCGKAVHLNCIAEWLSGRNSCPVCRSGLPGISGRVVRAASRDFLAEDEDYAGSRNLGNLRNARDVIVSLLSPFDTTTTTDDSSANDRTNEQNTTTTSDEEEEEEANNTRQREAPNINNDDTATAVDDTTTTSDSEDNENSDNNNISSNSSDGNIQEAVDVDDAAVDNTTTTTDSEDNINNNMEHEEEDTTTTSDVEPPAPTNIVYCDALYCRNRPAVDCSNKLCGRCCVLGGQYHCPRHNS